LARQIISANRDLAALEKLIDMIEEELRAPITRH